MCHAAVVATSGRLGMRFALGRDGRYDGEGGDERVRGFPTAVAPPPLSPRGSRSAYEVLVVGSGIGGCVAAARILGREGPAP
jgi:hypothetical protein